MCIRSYEHCAHLLTFCIHVDAIKNDNHELDHELRPVVEKSLQKSGQFGQVNSLASDETVNAPNKNWITVYNAILSFKLTELWEPKDRRAVALKKSP